MKKTILVAGATGNLGGRIVRALLDQGADVRVIARPSSDKEQLNVLERLGAKVFVVDMMRLDEVTAVCKGVSCVVSALSGLSEVIVDTQKVLLDAAVAAGVPRFVPSDYSLDFTKLPAGGNRNLDLRRTFHTYLDKATIAATTVFNGAFADMLTAEMPLILFEKHRVLHWGSADHLMSFTTVADTALFTANVALDDTTPRFLHIAGTQLSARDLQGVVSEVTGQKFKITRAGGSGLLGFIIKVARMLSPSEKNLYPAWQGMQYMHNMIDERSVVTHLDNNRYPAIKWTTVKDVISVYQSGK